jgi:hypothetical protein
VISELFTRGFISTVAWAIGLIFRSIIGRLLIAVVALFLGFVVTLYAVFFGVMLWFVVGRWGIVRPRQRGGRPECLALAALVMTLTAIAFAQGASWFHGAVIGALASMGAMLWYRRKYAFHLARGRLFHS